MAHFDNWAVLRVIEVVLVLACLIFKRVTDDEARSLFLYLQKLSREWSLLTNITWDKVGSSVADATFGGYLIITTVLLLGKIFGELPTRKRIMEWIFLGVGAILFIAIGSLSFASIDSVPKNLIDNAAILGTLSVLTGALFLLDMGGPKAKKEAPPIVPAQIQDSRKHKTTTHQEPPEGVDEHDGKDTPKRSITDQVYDIEREVRESEQVTRSPTAKDHEKRKSKKDIKNNVIKNGNGVHRNGTATKIETVTKEPLVSPGRSYIHPPPTTKGYIQMKDDDFDIPRRFGIYGKDASEYDTDETASIPPKIELHTPVWGNIRKETAKIYTIPSVVMPQSRAHDDASPPRPPSGPFDPGFVQYTAQHWGERRKNGTRTPRHSPTTDV